MDQALVIASPYTVVFAENKSAVNEKSSQAEYVEMEKREIWNISSGKSRMRKFLMEIFFAMQDRTIRHSTGQ